MSALQHSQVLVPESSDENDILGDNSSKSPTQRFVHKRLRQSSSDSDQTFHRKLPKRATHERNERPPPPPVSSRNDTSYVSSAKIKTKTKTFRISLIPDSLTHGEVKTWLEDLELSHGLSNSKNVVQLSIAPAISRYLQATVTFIELPLLLKEAETGTLCVNGPKKSQLVVDSHFHDMTVLHDPGHADAGSAILE